MALPLRQIGSVLALSAALAAPAAQAATAGNCLTRPEMRAMVAYFLPSLVRSAVSTCTPHLPSDSYLVARAPNLGTALEAGQDAAWPLAKAAFLKMGGGSKDMGAVAKMPDAVLRPFVEAAIEGELVPSIKPETCSDIDRVAATLEPLPADNTVDLIAEILNLAARSDKKIPACPAPAPVRQSSK